MTGAGQAWRALDPAELDREYSPSSMIPSIDAELAAYATASARARDAYPPVELPYGPDPAERLDLFLPPEHARPAPLLVFIHGGYWQELDKHDASFPAPALLERGIAYAALGYPLAPRARLGEIVDAVQHALEWLHGCADEYGIDPSRVHVAGSSAGAHLAAHALLTATLPFAGATLLSGIYDVRPLASTYVNDPLGLDEDEAWRLSPMNMIRRVGAPITVACGEIETSEFRRQSSAFADALTGAGNRVNSLLLAGLNHFDNVFTLTDPDTALGRATLDALEAYP